MYVLDGKFQVAEGGRWQGMAKCCNFQQWYPSPARIGVVAKETVC